MTEVDEYKVTCRITLISFLLNDLHTIISAF